MVLIRTHFRIVSLFHPRVCSPRYKHKIHWAEAERKSWPKDRALEHFDDFYKKVFGTKWHSLRLALLSPNKYCAVVNNFADTDETVQSLENMGAVDLKKLIDADLEIMRRKKKQRRRERDMKKIFKLDSELEALKIAKKTEEIASIYKNDSRSEEPPIHMLEKNDEILSRSGNDGQETSFDGEVAGDFAHRASLSKSLQEAEYDHNRIIDPSGNDGSAYALHEFVPATKLKGMENFVLESEHYSYYKTDRDFPICIEKEARLNYPELLKIFTYERGNVERFPSPKRGETGVFNYYLLDTSSVLPVLALDLKFGDSVLDMCAAPGGKSFIMLQTLCLNKLVCNDSQESRTRRIHNVLDQYLYGSSKLKDDVIVTHGDGRSICEVDTYDKILVDVPCTTDRHSVHENDNNIFKPTRVKERLRLPELQAQLLSNALKIVKPGGTVVYSTCTMSPIQNDGVVHMALRQVWEDTSIEVVIKDMSQALQPLSYILELGGNLSLKYGHMVLPTIPCNSGPTYFCKIVRKK